jgi:glycosyltransferase involved in cell wall biosynthesis
MGFGNCVLVNDTASNVEVIGDAGFSYKGSEGPVDLARQLRMLLDNPTTVADFRLKAEQRARTHYRWECVVRDHLTLYGHILGAPEVQLSKVIDS